MSGSTESARNANSKGIAVRILVGAMVAALMLPHSPAAAESIDSPTTSLSPVTSVPPTTSVTSAPPGTMTMHSLRIIGDSLHHGADVFGSLSDRIEASGRWRQTRFDSVPGRSIRQGARLLKKLPPAQDEVLMIALGTNDMLSRTSRTYPAYAIDLLMRRTAGRPVMWLTIEFDRTRPDWRSRGVRFNRELRKAAARWPNLTVADWSRHFEPLGASRFVSDGIHLTTTGYRKRANWTTQQLRRWHGRLTTEAPIVTIP